MNPTLLFPIKFFPYIFPKITRQLKSQTFGKKKFQNFLRVALSFYHRPFISEQTDLELWLRGESPITGKKYGGSPPLTGAGGHMGAIERN